MFDAEFLSITTIGDDTVIRSAHYGKYAPKVSHITQEVICDNKNKPYKKNGVILYGTFYDGIIDHYEIIVDGEFFSRTANFKQAIALFKDFSA